VVGSRSMAAARSKGGRVEVNGGRTLRGWGHGGGMLRGWGQGDDVLRGWDRGWQVAVAVVWWFLG
jgi:hypothetical protein